MPQSSRTTSVGHKKEARVPTPHLDLQDDLPGKCVFCRRLTAETPLIGGALVAAVLDSFPVSRGHSLVVPRRHVARVRDLEVEELHALWAVAWQAASELTRRYGPDGVNIGLNDGPAAGQTVPHVHVHVIPRYAGDVRDPRGGVRWVLPQTAPYWQRRSHTGKREDERT